MRRTLDRTALMPGILLIGVFVGAHWGPGGLPTAHARQNEAEAIIIKQDKRPVFAYRQTHVPFKPYVVEFYTPSGVNILRDAPSDHLHHHGLMYAMTVNGVDFWGEQDRPGRQLQQKTRLGARGLKARLQWLEPGGETLLVEAREIKAVEMAGANFSFLQWTSTFRSADKTAAVTLTGNHYHGLGMRFVESMDKTGRFLNAANAEGEVVRGDERLTPAAWCAYQSEADGRPVTVALFDAPDNPRPALWFTMSTPFAYLSATVNLWKQPVVLESSQSLTLTYGVALLDGHMDAETIESVYRKWLGKGRAAR